MGYLNSRTTHLNIRVIGEIDSIRFFQAARPQEPVAEINFSRQMGNRTIDLLNSRGMSIFHQTQPAQYFFVTRQGNKSYRSPTICCQTSFTNQSATLVIHGLDQWEKSDD
jgi:hypothetical protein